MITEYNCSKLQCVGVSYVYDGIHVEVAGPFGGGFQGRLSVVSDLQ